MWRSRLSPPCAHLWTLTKNKPEFMVKVTDQVRNTHTRHTQTAPDQPVKPPGVLGPEQRLHPASHCAHQASGEAPLHTHPAAHSQGPLQVLWQQARSPLEQPLPGADSMSLEVAGGLLTSSSPAGRDQLQTLLQSTAAPRRNSLSS